MKISIDTAPVVPALRSIISGLSIAVKVDKARIAQEYQERRALQDAYQRDWDKLKAKYKK